MRRGEMPRDLQHFRAHSVEQIGWSQLTHVLPLAAALAPQLTQTRMGESALAAFSKAGNSSRSVGLQACCRPSRVEMNICASLAPTITPSRPWLASLHATFATVSTGASPRITASMGSV